MRKPMIFTVAMFILSILAAIVYTAPIQNQQDGTNKNLDNVSDDTINVKNYGAKGDGISDDAPAIKSAIQAAIKSKVKNVFFPKGRYAFLSADTETHIIYLKNINNLTLLGEKDTFFIITKKSGIPGTIGFMRMEESNNITIKNISFDYDPLPFTQGVVVSIDKSTKCIEWKVDEGYPDPIQFFNKVGSCRFYDKEGKLNLNAPLLQFKDLSKVEEGIYKCIITPLQGNIQYVNSGDRIVYPPRYFPKNIFYMSRVNNLTLDSLNIYASPCTFVTLTWCDSTVIKNCVVEPLPKSNRLNSVTADSIYVVGGRYGPKIEGCRLEGNGDDNINIHGAPGTFYGFTAPDEIISTETPWRPTYYWRVGDRLEVVRDNSELVISAKILSLTEVNMDGKSAWKVNLDSSITDSKILSSIDKQKAQEKVNALVYNVDLSAPGFIIRNNIFRNHRARGLLINSRDGLIENNKFEHMDGGIIIGLLYGAVDKEGPNGQNIIIRNNSFVDLGTYVNRGAIDIGDYCSVPPRGTNIKNIIISSNVFTNCMNRAIYVNNATNIYIENNKISLLPEIKKKKGYEKEDEIFIDNYTKEITGKNNVIYDEPVNFYIKEKKIGIVGTMDVPEAAKEASPISFIEGKVSSEELSAGDILSYSLKFRANEKIDKDYRIFIHFIDQSTGKIIFQDDFSPELSTSKWEPGEVIEFKRKKRIPPLEEDRDVKICFGFYADIRLSITDEDGKQTRTSWILAELRLKKE